MSVRRAGFRSVVLFCVGGWSIAQTSAEKRSTYFENISVDSEGHICYYEPIGSRPLDRIEYRTNGKSEFDIFFESEAERERIQFTDFNNDGKVDLIYALRENIKGKVIQKIDFYRGPEYLEHLKRHYHHALLTATHPLIKHRPDEAKRAKEIEETLEKLEGFHIGLDEMGAYRTDMHFRRLDLAELSGAFAAADTLNNAVRIVLAGDFRVLARKPEITTKYNVEIKALREIGLISSPK